MILTVGALIPRKGQALVIEALPALPGVHYRLAGAGEAEGSYRALAQRLGVEARVHVMGPVANADLPMLYRAADVVVMPSVSEGLANAWVEALACGTPIVISDAGGAAELVTSPIAGRIVERTPEAIAAAVQAILAARRPHQPSPRPSRAASTGTATAANSRRICAAAPVVKRPRRRPCVRPARRRPCPRSCAGQSCRGRPSATPAPASTSAPTNSRR